ncbi:MAG: hypothetical protein ACRC6M_18455 [Microcystaceae cyanobacterium]
MIDAPVLSKSNTDLTNDSTVWDSLKQAIAASSGFQCWQEEQLDDNCDGEIAITPLLDAQVRHYLRQTLETLAY